MLFSLFQTLCLWDLNPRLWLTAYLDACAEAGGRVPERVDRFLPWNLTVTSGERGAVPRRSRRRTHRSPAEWPGRALANSTPSPPARPRAGLGEGGAPRVKRRVYRMLTFMRAIFGLTQGQLNRRSSSLRSFVLSLRSPGSVLNELGACGACMYYSSVESLEHRNRHDT